MRTKPKIVYRKESPNQSARTARVRLIVLHSTESAESEGSADLKAIANYFSNVSVQASSHVITDGDGHSARCVPDARKAWTCAGFNSASLNIEQIGRASQAKWPKAQLDETARWIARWSKQHDIPIQRGDVSGSSVTKSGVVAHSELGAEGGGHSDPGPNYPINDVLVRARKFAKEIK